VVDDADHAIMAQIDRQYLATPFYGSRRMTVCLQEQGQDVTSLKSWT